MNLDGVPPSSRGERACLLVVLSCISLRLLSSHDPYPGWSGDPFEMPNPIVGITPLVGLLLDVLLLVASLPLLRRSSLLRAWHAVGLAFAAVPVLVHASTQDSGPGGTIDNALIGFNWFASLIGAIAAGTACANRADRSLVMAALLGMCPLLAFKGLQQYFIEHAATLEAFKADKTRFIEAQGWAVGSPMALAYERRVSQPEATGWFGLANVYASLAAAFFVACAGLTIASVKSHAALWIKGLLAAATMLGAGMVVIAGAKGGFAAAGLGVLMLGVGHLAATRPLSAFARRTLGPAIAVASVAGVLLLVAARGVIGTRLGELSLLFRWFYLEGAATIFREHWLLGTGPAAFRDAYMLAKPALSPEDVSSPHSLLFDLACTLGLGGVVMGIVWFGLVLAAARVVTTPRDHSPAEEAFELRSELRWAMLPLVVGVLGGAWLEQPLATPESTLLRLLGLIGGGLIIAAVLAVSRRSPAASAVAVAAAAMALAAHSQIEMTGITPGSVGWTFCLIASAASVTAGNLASPSRSLKVLMGSLVAMVGIGMIPMLVRVTTWEMCLRSSYREASVVGELKMRLTALGREAATTDDSMKAVLDDLSRRVGHSVAASPEGVEGAVSELHRGSLLNAAAIFERAALAGFDHFPTQRTLSKLSLAAALVAGEPSFQRQSRAWSVAESIARRTGTASAWSWAATVRLAIPPEAATMLRGPTARECLEQAAALSPHEPSHPQRLARLLATTDPAASAAWAARALASDDDLRLDPLRRFTTQERAELERLRAASNASR